MGLATFLGIKKFGQGLASAGRVLTGQTNKDIQSQNDTSLEVGKLIYASKKETDPTKKTALLKLAQSYGTGTTPQEIDPGLNLSNKEVLGSAANVALNVATPGAFKGGKLSVIGKNAALGAAFGTASGLEKNRNASGIAGSTVGGAIVGAGIGTVSVGAKVLKDFLSKTTPNWLMNSAIKPSLDELRKNVKYGTDTLGDQLIKEGVKGGPKRLLQIADDKLNTFEDELQHIINDPAFANKTISKQSLSGYVKGLLETKQGIPGMTNEVSKIKDIVGSLPEQLTLSEANQMKRRIYNELTDVSYKLDSNLSLKGQALKAIAKGLKTEIEDAVGGTVVRDINQKLSIYGRLQERIVDQLARAARNNKFGLTDAILTAGGVASLNPLGFLAGLGGAGAKHLLGSTAAKTTAAVGLSKLQSVGTGVAAQGAKTLLKKATLNLP